MLKLPPHLLKGLKEIQLVLDEEKASSNAIEEIKRLIQLGATIQEKLDSSIESLKTVQNKIDSSTAVLNKIPKKEPRLIVVRHGSTALNEDHDRIRGWKDVPLSPLGIEEAHEMAEKLMDSEIDGIISSDLIRTQKTSEIISEKIKAPILEITKELRPWNLGIFTGQESKKVLPEMMRYILNPEEEVPGGESFNTFKTRFLTEIQRIKSLYSDSTIAIIAHHRNERVLAAWDKMGEPETFEVDPNELKMKGIPPGSFREVPMNKKYHKISMTKNDISNMIEYVASKVRIPNDGKPGKTPRKGIDYFTQKEKEQLIQEIGNKLVIPDPLSLEEVMNRLNEKDILKKESFTENHARELIALMRQLPEKERLGFTDIQDGKSLIKNLYKGHYLHGGAAKWKYKSTLAGTITGSIDGINKVFVLPDIPQANSLHLIYQGQYQHLTDDYTLSGATITFVVAPVLGTKIAAQYQ